MRERDEEDTDNDDLCDDEDPEDVVCDDDLEEDTDTDADGLRSRFFTSYLFAPLCSYWPLCEAFFFWEAVCCSLRDTFFRGVTLSSRLGTRCVFGYIRTNKGLSTRGWSTKTRGWGDTLGYLQQEKE